MTISLLDYLEEWEQATPSTPSEDSRKDVQTLEELMDATKYYGRRELRESFRFDIKAYRKESSLLDQAANLSQHKKPNVAPKEQSVELRFALKVYEWFAKHGRLPSGLQLCRIELRYYYYDNFCTRTYPDYEKLAVILGLIEEVKLKHYSVQEAHELEFSIIRDQEEREICWKARGEARLAVAKLREDRERELQKLQQLARERREAREREAREREAREREAREREARERANRVEFQHDACVVNVDISTTATSTVKVSLRQTIKRVWGQIWHHLM